LKICLIITSLIFIYNWNYLIAGWIEKSIFYFPHITKIYVVLLLLTSFLLRGIYYPLKRNIKKSYIFPFNWISIGFYGFTLDLVKAPGYLLGSIIPFALKKFKIKNNLNIVFYSKYGIKSPSYRTRFLAYKNYLEDNNFKVETKTLFSESFYNDRIFKNKNNIFKLSYFYLLRIYDLLFRKKPFLAIVHIEILPFIPFLGEKILNLRKIPFIIDIDDAVYFRFAKYNNFFNKLYKKKFLYSVNCSKGLFAGNNFHQTFFSKFKDKVFYLPTVINCNEYDKFLNTKKHSNFTVVWIGTPSTTNYLVKIINVLNDLVYYHNVSIKIIGADKSKIKNLKCETLEWNQKTELIELSKCHVGIMPLDNTPWELGKCGYKILQYMSLKLAVVASAVGVNKEIIKNGYNGLFANDDTDWQNAILKLKNDSSLINEFGKNGYDTVKNKFNLDYFKKKYKNIIENIHKSSICNYEKEN
jgi:glycosyltransferase involved in cell wall biosynthesis